MEKHITVINGLNVKSQSDLCLPEILQLINPLINNSLPSQHAVIKYK